MSDSDEKVPEILCFKDIKLKKLKWLWPNRFPLGKLALIVGDPEKGKSMLALYMAGQVSTGRPWVDAPNPNPPGSVVILTLEDDYADTVGTRLSATGADVSKIFTIDAINTGGKRRGFYNLTEDLDVLIKTVQRINETPNLPNVRLIIIDPISGYMKGKNENKNAEVREFLTPLMDLARSFGIAVVGISHLNKNQMTQSAAYRVLGSIGFAAAARAVWLVHQDPEDEVRRLFVPSKGNLCRKPTGLSYTIMTTMVQTEEGPADTGYCAFSLDPVLITARELLAPKLEKPSPKRDAAADWLQEYLSDGPKFVKEIFIVGSQMDFSEATLKRVKKKLSIQSIKSSEPFGPGQWEWSLPT